MTWREKIVAAHAAVTNAVSHYYRVKSDRYLVWQEERAEDLVADSRTLFLYGDPWADALDAAMTAQGIAWYRNSVQYEPETGLIHTEWVWEVTDG